MAVVAVHETVVDLVGDDQEIMTSGQGRDRLRPLAREHGPGRVVGIADQDGLGVRRDALLHGLSGHLEALCDRGWQGDGQASSEGDLRLIGDKGRCRDDDLVPWIEHGGQGQVEGLRDTDGHQELGLRIVANTILPLQVIGKSNAQLQDAGIGSVLGIPSLQRAKAGLENGIGCGEIRLPDAEGDHVVHRGGDIEESPDPGRGHPLHTMGDKVTHRSSLRFLSGMALTQLWVQNSFRAGPPWRLGPGGGRNGQISWMRHSSYNSP